MRARYYDYDPVTEQFISRDSLEAQTGQPYTYAYGNPVNFVDPDGMEGKSIVGWQPPLREFGEQFGVKTRALKANITTRIAKPLQVQIHHFASDKHPKLYTPQFKRIAEKFGLSLNQDWNKEKLPQRSNHPPEYHRFVLRNMRQAARIASRISDPDLAQHQFLAQFERLVKKPVRENPQMLLWDWEGWGR